MTVIWPKGIFRHYDCYGPEAWKRMTSEKVVGELRERIANAREKGSFMFVVVAAPSGNLYDVVEMYRKPLGKDAFDSRPSRWTSRGREERGIERCLVDEAGWTDTNRWYVLAVPTDGGVYGMDLDEEWTVPNLAVLTWISAGVIRRRKQVIDKAKRERKQPTFDPPLLRMSGVYLMSSSTTPSRDQLCVLIRDDEIAEGDYPFKISISDVIGSASEDSRILVPFLYEVLA
ncbi:MAG: hypothetical protein HGB18_04900 [Candidatus Moranbacteria bacterium]|nr:hypothetical protein [Candidatus Moranbacteria bacterium]